MHACKCRVRCSLYCRPRCPMPLRSGSIVIRSYQALITSSCFQVLPGSSLRSVRSLAAVVDNTFGQKSALLFVLVARMSNLFLSCPMLCPVPSFRRRERFGIRTIRGTRGPTRLLSSQVRHGGSLPQDHGHGGACSPQGIAVAYPPVPVHLAALFTDRSVVHRLLHLVFLLHIVTS